MLSVVEVGHRFGDQPFLFRGVSFEASEGQMLCLTGPSGSGKSTLLSILAGRTAPTEGSIDRVDNRISWLFQQPFGVPARTAIDHVAIPFLARGTPHHVARRSAAAALDRFNVGGVAGRRFGELSGGEAQRVLLARLLAINAPIALIDEPTAQLDGTSAEVVISVLNQLRSDRTLIVVATHDRRVRDACTMEISVGVTR